ncbi:MAG: DUF2723 domain-containing protein [Candidatus Promineifilaceae bacterium]|nr:DUF2723 domain-containing protein [Candidatus Promineifilaceae bacterium]
MIKTLAPGIALGLYLGRVLSEIWADYTSATPIGLAVGITLITVVFGALLTRNVPFVSSWPALFLLIYVFYPQANWATAIAVGALSLLVWLLIHDAFSFLNNKLMASIAAVLFGCLFFLLYLNTLAPDILPADSGEFQVVAANLGVAHPPGFPLYTILAHLITRLPIGPTPAFRVNLFSAITSAVTLVLIYLTVYTLTGRHFSAVISTVALGTATTFWAQSTTANIRSLSAFFTAAMFLSLIAFYGSSKDSYEKNGVKADRFLILFALSFGFGVTHHASLIFIGAVAVAFILIIDPSLLRSPGRWWRPILAFLVGLLPLTYIVLRAFSGARGASTDLATWPGFLEHILALGFRGDLFYYLEPALFWERMKVIGNVLTFQFEPLLIIGMIIGLILLLFTDRPLGLLFGGTFLVLAVVTATYRAPQSVEYLLPAYIPLVLLLGTIGGHSRIRAQVKDHHGLRHGLLSIILSIMAVAAVWQLIQNLSSYQHLHEDRTARDYSQSILLEAPEDSVILADWHWATPLWYLQEVETLRSDVDVRFVFPEGVPYGETWARRISEELANKRAVISTHYDAESYENLPTPEPIGEAYLFRTEPRNELPDQFNSLDVNIGDEIQIVGYGLEKESVQIGEEIVITLAWMPLTAKEDISLFAHLVGEDGQIYAQDDQPARAQPNGVTLTQFRLTPRIGAIPGTYDVKTGASTTETLLNSQGQERTTLSSLTVTNPEVPLATLNPIARKVSNDPLLQLIGYDWDNTLLAAPRLYLHWRTDMGYWTEVIDGQVPALAPYAGPWGILSEEWSAVIEPGSGHYVPLGQGIIWQGEQLDDRALVSPSQDIIWSQFFQSSYPILRDYTVSTRLIGFEEDGFHWAWWDLADSIPAMGAIPTLKWIRNSRIRSPHFVTVDPSAAPGQEIGGSLNLYDAFTGRVLPILDDRITNQYDWIPLGSTSVME